LISEYCNLSDWAQAAQFYGCSVFELVEREDREDWMTAWERKRFAESEYLERNKS